MSVQEYLERHLLSRKIEDAVNAAVRAKTSDPVIFISNHMRKAVPAVITKVKARQIIDCRGIPTVEVDLSTNKGTFRASVPSGDALGMYEASELTYGASSRFEGIAKAVKNINERISEVLVGLDPTLQSLIDQAMIDLDKTEKKSELGASAMLAVSIAACRAGAAEKEVPLYKHISDLAGKTEMCLPIPSFTMITGGKHAGNNLAVQDIMIVPSGAQSFDEALRMGSETYHHVKAVIADKYGSCGCSTGDDGGMIPNISSIREGLDIVKEAINRSGYKEKIKISIDVAATEFCIGTKYDFDFKSPTKEGKIFKSADDMIVMYKELCSEYPIWSIENPFDKEDWEHLKALSNLGLCQIVGDSFSMSNLKRLERAIHDSACDSLLFKANQTNTVTEAIDTIKLAKDSQLGVIISHSCGETDDTFIADLAVGLATKQIKSGAPCRGERLSKYNQLLRIEEELGSNAVYTGEDWKPI